MYVVFDDAENTPSTAAARGVDQQHAIDVRQTVFVIEELRLPVRGRPTVPIVSKKSLNMTVKNTRARTQR